MRKRKGRERQVENVREEGEEEREEEGEEEEERQGEDIYKLRRELQL